MRFKFASALVAAIGLGFASMATAADLPARGPAYFVAPVPTAFNWSGIYVGANAGGGWGTGHFCTDAFAGGGSCNNGDIADHTISGWLGGGQLGARWQAASWVFGVEGMWDGASIKGDNFSPLLAAPNRIRRTEINSLYSFTGSAGWAWDRWLVYGKGGWAGAQVDLSANNLNPGGASLQASTHYSGYTLGLGLEALVWRNVSLGIEYDYYNLKRGDVTNLANSAGFSFPCGFCNVSADVHTVTARANYMFNWSR